MKKTALFLFLTATFLFLHSFCFAQQNVIDSLLTLLKTEKTDTTKLIHLYKVSDEYETIGNYPDGLDYGKKALEIADIIESNLSSTDKKDVLHTVKKYRAKVYNNIGLIYYHQGIYPVALKNYFASLKIREEIGDKKGEALAYNNIGIVYYFQCNYSEALKNHFASLKTRNVIGDPKGIASSYNNIGNVYYKQKKYSEALKNYFASLKISETIGDKTSLAPSYNNIGNVYFDQGNSLEALKNYFLSLKIEEEIGNKIDVAGSYINIGCVYILQRKYKEAEKYLRSGKELSMVIGDKESLRIVYRSLADLDSARGDFKGAYENHKRYILYRDSQGKRI